MNPHFIELRSAKTILQPRVPIFAGSLRKAIQEWNNGLGAYHAIVDEFARGVLVNQFWYAYSSQAFRGDVGVSLDKHGNRHYYIVDDLLVLRLKHVDNSYRSWNHPTSRARAWGRAGVVSNHPPNGEARVGLPVGPDRHRR